MANIRDEIVRDLIRIHTLQSKRKDKRSTEFHRQMSKETADALEELLVLRSEPRRIPLMGMVR